MQKIKKSYLYTFKIVIANYLMKKKLKKVQFY